MKRPKDIVANTRGLYHEILHFVQDDGTNMPKYIFLTLIRLYQKTLSPDHGWLRPFFAPGVCIYRPTCSEYAYGAIRQYGVVRGAILGIKRLARCRPWHEGGYDPLYIDITL